jgi:peptidoglycan/LPS O-acetylase OafA/YrhL
MFVIAPLFPALDTAGFRVVAKNQVWLWTYTMNLFASFHVEIGGTDPFAGDWIQTLHFWSLSVEEQFYLVWPLIVLLATRRQLMGVCGACFIGAWALRVYFVAHQNPAAPLFFTLCRVDDLAVGAFIAVVTREKRGLAQLRACAPWLTLLAAGLLLGVGVRLRHFWHFDAEVQRYAISAFSVLYGCLLVFALTAPQKNVYRRLLEIPVLRSYGKYSYAIYIFHYGLEGLLFARIAPLDTLAERLGSQDAALAVRFLIVAIVSWGIGWLSWNAYEKHFLKLKRYFYEGRKDLSADGTEVRR